MNLSRIFLWSLVIGAEASLLALAHWQYTRMEEKQAELAAVSNRPQVTLHGAWENDATTVLDNQPDPENADRVGWRILTPLYTEHGVVVVDRGWVPLPPDRTAAPETKSYIPTTDTVTGVEVAFPTRKGWLKGPDTTTHPRILAWLNPALVTSATVGGTYLQATQTTSPHIKAMPPVTAHPEKHASYALQWLTMALIFPVLVVARARSRARQG